MLLVVAALAVAVMASERQCDGVGSKTLHQPGLILGPFF